MVAPHGHPCFLVLLVGVEPTRRETQEPKSCAYANFAKAAYTWLVMFYLKLHDHNMGYKLAPSSSIAYTNLT